MCIRYTHVSYMILVVICRKLRERASISYIYINAETVLTRVNLFISYSPSLSCGGDLRGLGLARSSTL